MLHLDDFGRVPFQALGRARVTSRGAPRWRLDSEKGAPRGCFDKSEAWDAPGGAFMRLLHKDHFYTVFDHVFKGLVNAGGAPFDEFDPRLRHLLFLSCDLQN